MTVVSLHDVKLIDTGFGQMIDESRPCDTEPSAAGPSLGQASARECAVAPAISADILAAELAARQRDVQLKLEASRLFREARLAVNALMTAMAAMPQLDPVYAAQARAIAGLSSLKLHKITGYADAEDAEAVRDDLEALPRVTDPLIEAIGKQLADNFSGVETKWFSGSLHDAVSSAICECDYAAERFREDEEDGDA